MRRIYKLCVLFCAAIVGRELQFAALLAFSIVLVGAISNSRASTVTYDFVNNAYPQNGYTIYGEIVTDGHTGFLNSSDTQSTLNPSSPYAATSLSISNSGYVTPLPAYFLGFNGLEVVGNNMYLDLGGMTIATSASSAAFELTFNNAGPGNPSTYAQGFINLAVEWSDGSLTGPLLIAVAAPTVPEPSAFVLAAIAMMGVVYLRRRGRTCGA